MDYFVLQKRLTERTAVWSVTSDSFTPLIQAGQTIPKGIQLTAVDDLQRDKEDIEFELLDYNGDGRGALISAAFKNCVEKLNPSNIQIRPITLQFAQTEADWFLLHPTKVYSKCIDMERTRSKRIDSQGNLIIPRSIQLCPHTMQSLAPQEQLFFTLTEFSSILIINEVCAHALESAGLQGFKAKPLATWNQGLCHEDPYLAPDHHPNHPDNLKP